ncbi:DUF2092 domain-containing protein [Rhizobium sp. T1470]|uniref:DUF2092 domain-containing protein n=1 Tax=unclassified Rhizobium TaxID=2613769 RepID=UPI001AAEBD85|nr:DUF2092 domain-containing protein [Rhizobium sp. T1473]MCA0802759.1 DUF2092 domain-containing protein [Rhizobium sp. T1473]
MAEKKNQSHKISAVPLLGMADAFPQACRHRRCILCTWYQAVAISIMLACNDLEIYGWRRSDAGAGCEIEVGQLSHKPARLHDFAGGPAACHIGPAKHGAGSLRNPRRNRMQQYREATMKIESRLVTGILALALLAPAAHAEDDARAILKSMSDYLAKQQTFSATFDTDIEVVTPDLQKLQFTSSGQVAVSRPNKMHAARTGGFSDAEMIFDGKQITIHSKDDKVFTQIDAAGTIDDLIAKLEADGYALPGADLLLANVYEELNAGVIDAKHIGTGVIGGVECEHLAFRNADTDWQLWVRTGAAPIPCKYVITSKAVTAAPQYTLIVKTWSGEAKDDFSFAPPANSRRVDPQAMPHIDEVPEGANE